MVGVEDVQGIAVNFVKETRDVTEVSVINAEERDGVWIVRGTCPIDLCGHPWRESFEVHIDQKGKIKSSTFKLM